MQSEWAFKPVKLVFPSSDFLTDRSIAVLSVAYLRHFKAEIRTLMGQGATPWI